MGRKLADLWDYADRLDKRFKCRFCLKDFTGGVVRLRSHLSGVKGGGIQLCSKVSEEAKNNALSSLNVVNKKRKTGPSSSDSDGGSSDICDANCNNEVGYSVAKYFFMSDTNCNMVESSSFTNLVNALSPGSTLPSSLELESKLIPSFKTEVEQYVSCAKQSWTKTGCTLIPIFELNEKEGRSFLSTFGCSSERTVLLDTFEVPINVDLVAPFLEGTVHSVVQSIGSHNIVQCVVDGSQYGEYFSKILCSKFPLVYLTKCAAREVQLMFEEIFQDVEWVRTTFNIIKSIVDYIWSDTTLLSLLSKYTNGKELKQSLGVNFLSSYKMLESILEVKDHLVQLVQSPEWLASGYGAGQHGIEVTSYITNPKTWERGEEVQKALRSLSQVLCSIDIHDSNSGYLYGLMEFVEHSISQLRSNNQDMYQRLWDIYMLKKRQILSEFHSVAAFLNPAYMRTEQAKNVDRNPIISYIMERFIAEGDREDFVKEVYEYRKILSDGSKLFEATAAKAYHPCQWWETCGQNLTMLRNLAIRILSQPSSASTCKSSLRTVEAVLVKEQRELARGITDLDLKMNAILMERFKKDKAYHEREKIVLEEFSKQRSNNGESTSGSLRQLKLCFMTEIASPILIGQNVEGKKGCRIHVCLEDPTTGRVVQDGIPSTLPLTISVLDGHFSNESSSEEHSTREYFNRNQLPSECPYITGDLGVTLIRGEGTLGNFSFNYSSVDRESGQFKLAVKTHTGFCNGFRILEGISNAFTVEDVEAEVRIEQPVAHVDQQNGSFSSNPGLNWASNIDPFTENESDFPLAQWIATPYYPLQGFDQSLAQTASRRVKKKALSWQLQSCGRRRMLKRGSQTLKRKRRGEEVFEPKREVYSSGSNNVNRQEEAEKHDEPMEVEEVDSLSCCSTTAVARDYISAKPEGFEKTLFGDRVAASCSGKQQPIRETPAHPSTALQLSNSTRANNVNHQNEDDKAVALKEIVPQVHSISIKKRKDSRREIHMPVWRRRLGMDPQIHDSRSIGCPSSKNSTRDAVYTKEVAYEDENDPLASPDLDLKLFGVRLTDRSSQKGSSHCCVSGFDPSEVRKTDYTCMACMAVVHASKDFVLHSTSSERKKGFIQEEPSFKDYQVFLSCRGKDTRCGLTDTLYQYMIDADFKAFVDKPATLSGDSIEQTTVMNAIDNSKICVCTTVIEQTEADVLKSTTMTVPTHCTINQQEVDMQLTLQECCSKKDPPSKNSDIEGSTGSLNPTSDRITTDGAEPAKEDDMATQIEACEFFKMNMSNSIHLTAEYYRRPLSSFKQRPSGNPLIDQPSNKNISAEENFCHISLSDVFTRLHSTLSERNKDTYCRTGVTEVETSSKRPNVHCYDVFLSFRGPDTFSGFTGELYQYLSRQGIEVFKDDTTGDPEQAVENCKMSIVVLSRSYASSRQCLDELVMMLEKKKHITPIYIGVTPDDIELKTDMYTDELARHEIKYGKELVQEWREALKKVARIKGWELKDNRSFDDLIEEVALEIQMKLKVTKKYEVQQFVEMERHTKEDDMSAQLEARESVKMDSSDFSHSDTPISVFIGHGVHVNGDKPSSSSDFDLKLFGVPLTDRPIQKSTSLVNVNHCALSGLDLDDERMTDKICMADGQAPEDFVSQLHCNSSEKNKGTPGEETCSKKPDADRHDVFLCFSGLGRKDFTSNLRQSLKDERIRIVNGDNEVHDDDMLQAIDNAEICVPIFLKTFASSSWRLRQLEMMVKMKKTIIPVFYDVIPDDVELKTIMYTDELAQHETKYGKELVQEWSEALKEVATMVGYEWEGNMSFVYLTKKLAREIQLQLKRNEMSSEDFEHQQLILNPSSWKFRISSIINSRTKMQNTSRMIYRRSLADFLDDLTKMQNIFCANAFEPDSTLEDYEELSEKIVSICKESPLTLKLVGCLLHGQGKPYWESKIKELQNIRELAGMPELELFSRNAFEQDSPPVEYQHLCNEVVSLCRGHPWALQLLGRLLRGHGREFWENKIKMLRENEDEWVDLDGLLREDIRARGSTHSDQSAGSKEVS